MSVNHAELDISKINAEIARLMAQTSKLNAERLNSERSNVIREIFWYPVAIASGMLGAAATITVVIWKILG